ncbi:MAG: uroporphyrinogen decarboxylase family protein, partial [Verrucomicrobiales bacterium]|nr:uroporphyrinogen decarboxylase family protein [Verrucomicrobiales bacterium]
NPLAVPLMDLMLEKQSLLQSLGIPAELIDTYHFTAPPADGAPTFTFTPRMAATCAALRYIAAETDLVPVGMCIGPFSLMTKLLSDPITPVFLAAGGADGEEEPEVALMETCLRLSLRVIMEYVTRQIAAGARALFVCEPAANLVYFSPNQLAEDFGIFERLVIEPNRQLRELLRQHHVELIFHDCGELTDGMVSRFAKLEPVMLSLGSSRKLWEDARLVPDNIVLYGNLPSKHFYSDETYPVTRVRAMAAELREQMRATGHPFILGSECDVLSVPGSEQIIQDKVNAFTAWSGAP